MTYSRGFVLCRTVYYSRYANSPMNMRTVTRLRTGLGWLVIAVFTLRCLIPVGYMPDFADGGKAGPTIRICGGQHDGQKSKNHDAPCPFSVNSIFGLDGLQDVPSALPIYVFVAFLALTALVLSPQRRFGNASSRGPPRIS